MLNAATAIAYVRTRPDCEDGAREAIAAWAAQRSVHVAAWHVDTGVDAATPIAERSALLAAYRALREHDAGVLVAANAAQFSTDALVCWLIERAALAEGAAIRVADETTLPPQPRASEEVGYTRGAIDLARAYDRVTSRARMRALFAEKKARGERVGTVPYGYRLAADGVHLEPCPREQQVIASILDLSRAGMSGRAIVRELEGRGVTGRTGASLGQTQVAKILRAVDV